MPAPAKCHYCNAPIQATDGEWVGVQDGNTFCRRAPEHVHARNVVHYDACPRCGAPAHYVATFGAPGVGQSWDCANGHALVKLGSQLIDPDTIPDDEEPPWILSEEDVR